MPTDKITPKKFEIIDGLTVKYHKNGKTVWSKGKIADGKPEGFWQWYRIDGTIKRSGYFEAGNPVGEWITYDKDGKEYKKTNL
jgi:antitoxin component YwqK of YwqJK toxin-antitoxin module